VLFYTFVAYLEGHQNKKKTRNLSKAEGTGVSKSRQKKKYMLVGVRIMQERFLNSSLALCLGFVLFYTFLAYLKGPENKKTRNLLKAEAIQCLK
jgi:hypothetical protein